MSFLFNRMKQTLLKEEEKKGCECVWKPWLVWCHWFPCSLTSLDECLYLNTKFASYFHLDTQLLGLLFIPQPGVTWVWFTLQQWLRSAHHQVAESSREVHTWARNQQRKLEQTESWCIHYPVTPFLLPLPFGVTDCRVTWHSPLLLQVCWQYLLASCRMCKFSYWLCWLHSSKHCLFSRGIMGKKFQHSAFIVFIHLVLFIHHLLNQDPFYSKTPGCNHGSSKIQQSWPRFITRF